LIEGTVIIDSFVAESWCRSWTAGRPSSPQQFRQPGDVDGDATRLVVGQHLGLQGLGLRMP
jgi:hypothetical protein